MRPSSLSATIIIPKCTSRSVYGKDLPESNMCILKPCATTVYRRKQSWLECAVRLFKINSWQVLMLLLVQDPHQNHSNARKKRGLVKLPGRGAQGSM